jgi:hypothetical protein
MEPHILSLLSKSSEIVPPQLLNVLLKKDEWFKAAFLNSSNQYLMLTCMLRGVDLTVGTVHSRSLKNLLMSIAAYCKVPSRVADTFLNGSSAKVTGDITLQLINRKKYFSDEEMHDILHAVKTCHNVFSEVAPSGDDSSRIFMYKEDLIEELFY